MRSIYTFFIFIMVITVELSAQQTFSVSPAKPIPGERLTVVYNPKEIMPEYVDRIFVYVFQYDRELLQSDEVMLEKEGELWKGMVITKPETKLVVFAFYSEDAYDNNKSEGYITYLYDKSGQILPGAFAAHADFKVEMTSYLFTQDFKKAQELLNAEFKANPQLKEVFLPNYLNTIFRTQKDVYWDSLRANINRLKLKKELSKYDLATLHRAYSVLKDSAGIKWTLDELKKINPTDKLLQQLRLTEIYNSKNLKERIALSEKSKVEFPEPTWLDKVHISIANNYADSGKYDLAYNHVKKYLSHIDVNFYNTLASKMIKGNGGLAKAADIAKEAIEYGKMIISKKNYERDNSTTLLNAEFEFKNNLGYLFDTYYTIQLRLDDKEESYRAIEEAYYLTGKSDIEIDEKYINSLVDRNRSKEALNELESLVVLGKKSDNLLRLHKKLYALSNDSQTSFAGYYSALEDRKYERIIKNLKPLRINESMKDFTLMDLNGNKVSLSDFKGQKVVIDFWSTSCGPCLVSLPWMKAAVAEFERPGNVKFLFINTQDSEGDKKENLIKFVKEKKYSFSILIDEGGSLRKELNISALPTKLIIDENGKIRFLLPGTGGPQERLLNELRVMLKLSND